MCVCMCVGGREKGGWEGKGKMMGHAWGMGGMGEGGE